jgi:hypothetical protein
MARRRSPFVPLFALALCAAIGWTYFGPHMALVKLQRAAESGDIEAMNELVDFPALRTSVKENAKTAVSRELSNRTRLPGVGAIGGMLAGRVVNPLVDLAVTPSGVAALTSGRLPGARSEDGAQRRGLPEGLKMKRGYEGMGRFEVRYVDRESGDERIALIMRRDGLDWKLTGVRFVEPETR